MNKGLLLTTIAFGSLTAASSATIILQDSFSYPDGALAGVGGWTQNTTTATNPIQVTGGVVGPLTTGQDVYNNFASTIAATDGTFAYYHLTINVSAAASGEYFVHFTNGAVNPVAFTARLGAKTGVGASTFALGYSESTAAGFTYGADLALNTDYQVIVRYGFVAGTLNDTGAIFVTSGTFDPVESNNTAYVTDAYNGATAEVAGFTGIQLRQGSSGSTPTVKVDNLIVGTTFADVAAVPEPTSAVALIGGVGMLLGLRRRSSRIA